MLNVPTAEEEPVTETKTTENYIEHREVMTFIQVSHQTSQPKRYIPRKHLVGQDTCTRWVPYGLFLSAGKQRVPADMDPPKRVKSNRPPPGRALLPPPREL